MKKTEWKSPALLFLTAVVWGVAFVAQSVGMDYVGPFTFNCIRCLIGAVVLMRPSKSVQDLELKSVRKKFKSKGFAAGCSREVIEKGAEMMGLSLDELIQQTIDALKTFQD